MFSYFKYIYPGPHQSIDGKIDNRVHFAIPAALTEEGNYLYIVFPHGGTGDEITELEINPDTLF